MISYSDATAFCVVCFVVGAFLVPMCLLAEHFIEKIRERNKRKDRMNAWIDQKMAEED